MIQFIEDKEFIHTSIDAGIHNMDFEEFTFKGLIYKPNYDENFDTHCSKGTQQDYDTYERLKDIFDDGEVRTICDALELREREIKSCGKTLHFNQDSVEIMSYMSDIDETFHEEGIGDIHIFLEFYTTMNDYDIDDQDIMYGHAHNKHAISLPCDYQYEDIIDHVLKLEHTSLVMYSVDKIERIKEVGTRDNVVLDRRKKLLHAEG